MEKLHVKTGDTVIVLSGKDRKVVDKDGNKVPNIGKVIATSPEEGKVIVEHTHIVAKHTKARRQGETSSIVKTEGAIYASKVQLVCMNSKCEKYKKPIRAKAAYKQGEDGKNIKYRACPKCGEEI